MVPRRTVVAAGGLVIAGLGIGFAKAAASPVLEIRMKSDAEGSRVWFDPVGLLVNPGATIRWILDANVHTATAYHPANDGHSLRIPEAARPWDSGLIDNPGDRFETTLTAEGVYDYFCAPHEMHGMVGRIIVGRPVGPGALPFDYFKRDPKKAAWKAVPDAARSAFPDIAEIMKKRIVSRVNGS